MLTSGGVGPAPDQLRELGEAAERQLTSVLTEEEVRVLREGLESAGLRGHVAETIAGYAVPSLEMSAAATVPVGATKIVGLPDLSKET